VLFNSYVFILIFLPIVLAGFHLIGKVSHHRVAITWLVSASLFFYGWWNPAYLGILVASIMFNYAVGVYLGENKSKSILTVGVVLNLGLLCYFKYTNFFVENLNDLTGSSFHLEKIILPLAISFFTFQQIAYLVDAYRGLTREYNFLHYCLFVTFFPQLIAGPIVHHKDMLPQFENNTLYKLKASHLSVGLVIFMLGLFKKVVLADNIAIHATPVFDAAEDGEVISFFDAWAGALAYSFQLYFDFSGYSDMAIGIARMFGVVLPVNFYSPYKSKNIIEFWRRWHITLSSFLRDYLYIPLGGGRNGKVNRHINLMITMLLGGFWHGAGWTFLIWGGMHGLFLVVNHTWRELLKKSFPQRNKGESAVLGWLGRILTFICVVIAWVIFRAESLDGALNIYAGMFGINGVYLSVPLDLTTHGFREVLSSMFPSFVFGDVKRGINLMLMMLIVVWFLPNTFDLLKNNQPALGLESFITQAKTIFMWKFNVLFASALALMTITSLFYMSAPSEFLYFQF